jgi:drug/metabolite transporter (DMT)-like permease
MMSAKFVEARITALAMLTAPPLTLVLAYLLLDELPLAREILGGMVMLVGIAIPILALARPGRNAAKQ